MSITVDPGELVSVIEAEARRLGLSKVQVAEAFAERHGGDPKTHERRLRTIAQQDSVNLDVADRWLTALDLTLEDLPNPPIVEGRRRGGGHAAGVYGYITDDQVRACHVLYMRGLSVRKVAEQIHPRTRYRSVASCANSLFGHFARLGLPRRDRIEAVKLACTTHGLAPKHGPRPGYQTHKRRVIRGQDDQPRCEGMVSQGRRRGERCGLRAMFGSRWCQTHAPERAEQVAAITSMMRNVRGSQAGERHPLARLTADDVRAIRAREGASVAALAAEFGVTKSNVYRIRAGKSWRHLLDEDAA